MRGDHPVFRDGVSAERLTDGCVQISIACRGKIAHHILPSSEARSWAHDILSLTDPPPRGKVGGCGSGAWAICTRHSRRWYYKSGNGCTECYLEHGEPEFGSREHAAYMQWLAEHSTGGLGIITGGKQG